MTARYQKFEESKLTPEQRKAWDEVAGARKGAVATPFQVLLESPELCSKTAALGAFCRFGSSLPPRLSELLILTVARHWNCEYEFVVHTPHALTAGVPQHEIDALREGRRPEFEDADAALVYAYATELLQRRDVSDTTFNAAVERFGKKTTVELSGIIGYYTHLALVMLSTRVVPKTA